MLHTILSVVGGAAAWVACGSLNYYLYGKMFGHEHAFTDRDLLVGLGPIGTLMLALMSGLMGLLKLSQSLGQRLINAPFIVLATITLLVPYFGAVVTNHVFYNRVFPDSPAGGDRDLIVALGPLGTFMLALCAGLGAFLGLCKKLGERRLKTSI